MTLLVVGMAVTGCSAVSADAPMKTIQPTPTSNASAALKTVPLESLLPTADTASKEVGTGLNADGKPELTSGNTATPRPTDGLIRCELALNDMASASFSESVTVVFDGTSGKYSATLSWFKSDTDAIAFVGTVAKFGKYCPTQAGSDITAWDSGIPESAGFIRTDSSTSYGTVVTNGTIVAISGGPTSEAATKMLQLLIRTLATVK